MSSAQAALAQRSSFYLGMRVLPKARREAMYAIYAFCREVDDIADDQTRGTAERASELDAWRRDIESLYAGGDPGRAAFLADPVRRFALDRADFEAVIDGMAMDVAEDVRWPSAETLDLYCDRVASAVGRLSVKAFGMDEEPGRTLAYHLGRALQLTNILRDIDEDAAIGRMYLPREALDAAGIVPTTPAEVAADPRLDAAARQVAAEARRHFDAAHALLAGKPEGHLLAPRLMDIAYGRLLDRMERTGWKPPRSRPRTNKIALAFTALRLMLLP